MIRPVAFTDAPQIAEIYNYYILNTQTTFEEKAISSLEARKRIRDNSDFFPWLVFEDNTSILGYAYAGQWKARSGYKYAAEVSVYLRYSAKGKGIGTELYTELFTRLEKLNIKTLIAGIAMPNEVSIKLHKKFGFEQVADFKKVGYKFENWVDVTYWQLFLTGSN